MRRPLRTILAAAALAVAASLSGLAVVGAVANAAPTPASSAPSNVTRSIYVRPVTANGQAATGWTVKREDVSLDCDGASPSAVDPGIASCYPTAAAARACWKSTGHTVLCVADARTHVLRRSHYQGRFPTVTAPATPTPMDLQLGDGRRCLIRDGGAWSAPSQHPQWVGYDSCDRSAGVYGPGEDGTQDGIDRTQPTWTVRLWRTRPDDIVRRKVETAWYVGTAAD